MVLDYQVHIVALIEQHLSSTHLYFEHQEDYIMILE